jgi:DNA-binding protein YbaB
MSTAMHNLVEEAAKELRRRQARLKAIRKKLEGTTIKVSSKDRMVTVTIGQTGTLESIEFNSQKFRRMAPSELEAVLVETIRQAQAETRERLLRAYQPLLPDTMGIGNILAGKTDLDQMFEDAIRQADGLMSGQTPVRAGASGRAAANGRAGANGRAAANGKDNSDG